MLRRCPLPLLGLGKALGLFDSIIAFTKVDRDAHFDSQKPFCILEVLHRIPPDDVLVWADAGCVVYNSEAAFDSSLHLCQRVREHQSGVLRFDSTRLERVLTKKDVFDEVFPEAFFDLQGTQLTGNRFFLRKCDSAARQIQEWAEYARSSEHLFNDSPSRDTEAPEFREHRHHHSVFSLISKRRGCAIQSTEVLDVAIKAVRRKEPKQGVHAGDPVWVDKFLEKLRQAESGSVNDLTYSALIEAHAKSEKAAEVAQRLLQNDRQYALHKALTLKDNGAAAWLVTYGDRSTLTCQNKNAGCTPLMCLAMGHCKNAALNDALLWRVLERGGAGPVVACRSNHGHTAADYAQMNHRCEEVVQVLTRLEAEEVQRTRAQRCSICNDLAPERPLLEYFAERAERGEEDNALLKPFFENGHHRSLLQQRYHQINDMRQIRKELSESLAILTAMERAIPEFGESWHIIDLCCSKCITALVASKRYPGVLVSAIDILEPHFVPHFNRGGDVNVQYVKLDVLADSFVSDLERLLRHAGRPTVVLGMHLCGMLSMSAISAFEQLDLIQAVVLCPCCLPKKSDPRTPPHLYSSKDQSEQYQRWAGHLESLLNKGYVAQKDSRVSCELAADMLSPKNLIITAARRLDVGKESHA
eukprot:TRINITY_DN33764_c0_g1_i1.p1 TRINITY_DN33764_c0_g1~~TRINITY_DN33764_c0_g1_i1.p1  ORF type:complete len:642 (+),score=66.87 TRINITY_DN33764_c0_g1_i1:56-1981(+)